MSSAFRLDRYIARIGFNGPIGPDLATLSTIHAAHVDAIILLWQLAELQPV